MDSGTVFPGFQNKLTSCLNVTSLHNHVKASLYWCSPWNQLHAVRMCSLHWDSADKSL